MVVESTAIIHTTALLPMGLQLGDVRCKYCSRILAETDWSRPTAGRLKCRHCKRATCFVVFGMGTDADQA